MRRRGAGLLYGAEWFPPAAELAAHAFATILFDEGEELSSIAAALGHTSVDTTKRVYAHLLPKRARATPRRIDHALGRLPAVSAETG